MSGHAFVTRRLSLGISSWFGIPLPLSRRLALIQKAGFGFTDIWWEPKDGPSSHVEATRTARDLGLEVHNAHLPFDDCMDFWRGKCPRDSWLARIRKMLDACAQCSVPIAVLHVTKGKDEVPIDADSTAAMALLVRHAEDVGVSLALENTRHPHFLNHFLREISAPRLGLCFDTGHAVAWGGLELLSKYEDRVFVVHLSDNDGENDRHWIPGEGVTEWEHLFPLLEGKDILLEVASRAPEDDAPGFLTRSRTETLALAARFLEGRHARS